MTLRLGGIPLGLAGSVAADPRINVIIEQAAWHGSRANERIGQQSSSKRFYLSTTTWGRCGRRRGPSTAAGRSGASIGWKRGRSHLSQRPRGVVVGRRRRRLEGGERFYLSLGDHVGSSIIIIIIEASNLDEGQGWNTSH